MFFFSKYLDRLLPIPILCKRHSVLKYLLYTSIYFSRYFAKKKDVDFCETTDTAHSYIKQIVNFLEIKVSIDA